MHELLLVIDFINDIVHPDGKISSSAQYIKENKVIEKANQAIVAARLKGMPIVFVKVGFSPSYIECPLRSPLFGAAKKYGALTIPGWGTDFHEELAIEDDDAVIVKTRVSALYNTPLESILRANKIDKVYIAGVSTNMAVSSTARELHDRDYLVAIIEDACGAGDLATHKATIATLKRIADVIQVSDFDV